MTTNAPTLEGLSAQVEGVREGQARLETHIDETNRRIDETNRLIAENQRETNKRIDETKNLLIGILVAVIAVGGGIIGGLITLALKLPGAS